MFFSQPEMYHASYTLYTFSSYRAFTDKGSNRNGGVKAGDASGQPPLRPDLLISWAARFSLSRCQRSRPTSAMKAQRQ